jgi:hypothetical protein
MSHVFNDSVLTKMVASVTTNFVHRSVLISAKNFVQESVLSSVYNSVVISVGASVLGSIKNPVWFFTVEKVNEYNN